ncbi:hypothetical protein [Natrarchaeobaculum sulfurireducens]|uniref:hypothetical protein n=1 Tax=Natrarchaeobaculum sulfurireducens TaxID=2044521 RepID=UPI00105AB066|nr:hypothetical protein [Natrarchaeobaculum sulfurireducens]
MRVGLEVALSRVPADCGVSRAYDSWRWSEEDRPRRLCRDVVAGADPAIHQEFAYAQGEVSDWGVVLAGYEADTKGGCIGCPEGIRGDWVAFPEFRAADLTICGPFSECKNVYVVYVFNQFIGNTFMLFWV